MGHGRPGRAVLLATAAALAVGAGAAPGAVAQDAECSAQEATLFLSQVDSRGQAAEPPGCNPRSVLVQSIGVVGGQPLAPPITVVEPSPAPAPGTEYGVVGPPINSIEDAITALGLGGYSPTAGAGGVWAPGLQVFDCVRVASPPYEICGPRWAGSKRGARSFGAPITVVEPGQAIPAPPPGTVWGTVGPPIYGELDAQIALALGGYDVNAGSTGPWTTGPLVWQCWISPYSGDEVCGYR